MAAHKRWTDARGATPAPPFAPPQPARLAIRPSEGRPRRGDLGLLQLRRVARPRGFGPRCNKRRMNAVSGRRLVAHFRAHRASSGAKPAGKSGSATAQMVQARAPLRERVPQVSAGSLRGLGGEGFSPPDAGRLGRVAWLLGRHALCPPSRCSSGTPARRRGCPGASGRPAGSCRRPLSASL